MSIIALKKNSQAKHCKNHSKGSDGFSVWPTVNSGIYNGSRLISGFSAVQTPFKGNCAVGVGYVDRYGRGGYAYNTNTVSNCANPSGVCKKDYNTVLNTSGLLSNKLLGTRHGDLNTVKQFVNNGIQSEYINVKKNEANICYANSISNEDIFDMDRNKNCNVHSILIGNGRKIYVGNYVKTGTPGALGKQSSNYNEYNNGPLMKNNK
tara:strand:- start:31 stop:651 length:621 start_codon:yes stop_codon:yes gene_type:complete